MKVDPRIEETERGHSRNYRQAKWNDFVHLAGILRVDVLRYTQNVARKGSTAILVVDRIVGDTAYAIVQDQTMREITVSRNHLERNPTLEGGDNYLYFVAKT